jgi:hypothetical protein
MSAESSTRRGVGLYAAFGIAAVITVLLTAALFVPSRADLRLDRRVPRPSPHPVLDEPTRQP